MKKQTKSYYPTPTPEQLQEFAARTVAKLESVSVQELRTALLNLAESYTLATTSAKERETQLALTCILTMQALDRAVSQASPMDSLKPFSQSVN